MYFREVFVVIEKRAFERDRRSFGRIKIMIPALVSVAKPVEDITCDILDISEQGMRISIPQKTYQNVHIRAKDIIHFKFIDDFYMGKSAESDPWSVSAPENRPGYRQC